MCILLLFLSSGDHFSSHATKHELLDLLIISYQNTSFQSTTKMISATCSLGADLYCYQISIGVVVATTVNNNYHHSAS